MNDKPHYALEVEGELFTGLSTQVRESTGRIIAIAGEKSHKEAQYKKTVASFVGILQKGLDPENIALEQRERLYIVNELATNRIFFELTLKYDAFYAILSMAKKTSRVAMYKKLFLIYFNYFHTLQKNRVIAVLEKQLKKFLRSYQGKNRVVLKYKALEDDLFGSPLDLLDRYGGDLEMLERDLNLQDDFEYTKMLIKHKIVSAVSALDYNENAPGLFASILKRQDLYLQELYFYDGLTLKESIARLMIGRAMQERTPYHNWQQFLFKMAGDPRSMKAHSPTLRTWNNIGQKEKAYFIKSLFKDDMKLFLDVLSDPESDPDYAYRKAFWMPFLEHVIFAKVFIADTVFPTLNSELKERFQLHNDSYGILHKSYSQSAIYMDFGRLKIIEFTRIGHMRAFRECPMNLRKKNYSMKELDDLRFLSSCLFPIKHGGSITYTWQEDLLPYMNRGVGLKVTKEEIRIPEDRDKRLT